MEETSEKKIGTLPRVAGMIFPLECNCSPANERSVARYEAIQTFCYSSNSAETGQNIVNWKWKRIPYEATGSAIIRTGLTRQKSVEPCEYLFDPMQICSIFLKLLEILSDLLGASF